MKRSALPPRRTWLPNRTKPIARSWLKRSCKRIPQFNAKRRARRLKAYRAHLASAYWKRLRRAAYERDSGLCQCPTCIAGRGNGHAFAFEPIAVWFDTKGGIHGFSTHHTTYVRFGTELLSDVLTMHPSHHNALEAMTGIRASFLRSLPRERSCFGEGSR